MRALATTTSATPSLAPSRVQGAGRLGARELGAAGPLALLVVASAAVRSVFAVRHPVPRFFPDEYIYAALGRAIGHGNLQIRGTTAHFPAILEPVLAAPFWRLFGTTTAYHAIQVENAVFASLAAIPIYLIARRLDVERTPSLLCALFGLAVPELALAAYNLSDSVAYPLILGTVAVAAASLEQPTARRQIAFLGLALLSTLARVEYALVVPAYLVAALVLERRRALRTHRIAFAAVVPVAGAVASAAVGYYYSRSGQPVALHPLPLLHWFGIQAFLLTLSIGVVVVPGAVAALLRPQGRREKAYAVFTGAFALCVLAAAAEGGATTDRFKDRYLMALPPLLAIAFAVYLKRRPLRNLVLALSCVLVIAAAELPLSSYTAATFKTDSQFLFGLWFIQRHSSAAAASLVAAGIATAGCALAIGVAFGRVKLTGLVAGIAFLGVFAALATVEDLQEARAVRASMPADLTWVDAAAGGRLVTAVATAPQVSSDLQEELFWNASIQREVKLAGAIPSDAFPTPDLRVDGRGRMTNVRGDVLVDDSSATAVLADATPVARAGGFTLWRPGGAPRLRLLITSRYADGWLGERGAIRAWPDRAGSGVRVSLSVSLPRGSHPTTMKLGRARFLLRPGRRERISCSAPNGPLGVGYSSPNPSFDSDLQSVIARVSDVRVEDVAASAAQQAAACIVSR